MNPYYQFAMVEGYSNADAKLASKADVSEPMKEEVVKEEISTLYTRPLKEEPTIYTRPLKEEPTIYTTRPAELEPTRTEPTATYIGDASLPVRDGTTINIFNPDGQTSSTTSSGGISVDTETGEFDTEATDPNAGNAPSGGGGGGFGGAPSGGKGKAGARIVQKTMLPILVIAAGIAVIILKPIK